MREISYLLDSIDCCWHTNRLADLSATIILFFNFDILRRLKTYPLTH